MLSCHAAEILKSLFTLLYIVLVLIKQVGLKQLPVTSLACSRKFRP
jgi:hypothetical protein